MRSMWFLHESPGRQRPRRASGRCRPATGALNVGPWGVEFALSPGAEAADLGSCHLLIVSWLSLDQRR